jgi:hypothetical protein
LFEFGQEFKNREFYTQSMISTRSVIFTDANVIKTHALRTRGVIINAEYDFHTLKGDFETYE